MVIAIDGPAGVGKSTIARKIAEETGFYYLNSGNFNRAIGLAVIETETDPKNKKKCQELAKSLTISINNNKFFLNGKNVENLLGGETVGKMASDISVDPEIRDIVNAHLLKISENLSIVCEGRDMTTVVFPNAEFKFYFDATAEVRAERRFKQNPENSDFSQILQKIQERDKIDKNKPVGSLKIANDATYIDTSYLTISAVCAKVLTAIKAKNDIKGSGETKWLKKEKKKK